MKFRAYFSIFILLLVSIALINTLSAQDTDLVIMQEVAENAAWGDNVTITVNEEEGTFTFESNGLPADIYGGYLEAYIFKSRDGNGTAPPEAVDHTFVLPLQPQLSEADKFEITNQGTIGIIISGAVLYNPFEGGADSDIFAVEDNFNIGDVPFVDDCGGHPDVPEKATFHYHGIPHCVTDVVDIVGEHSVLIGYLFDGFPIHGPQDVDGEEPSNLNECNAHFGPTSEFPDGIWHYHLIDERPYSIECYMGIVAESLMQAGQGGGEGGAPQGGGEGSAPQGEGGNPPPPGGGGNPPPPGGGGNPPPPPGG